MKHLWKVLAGWGSSMNNRLIPRIVLMIYLSLLGDSGLAPESSSRAPVA